MSRSHATAAAAGLAALGLPAAVGHDPYVLYVLGTAWLYAALATAWNLLAFAGAVSFGHAAFFGIGAYTSALLVQRGGWTPWLGVLAAGLGGATGAVPVGLTAARVGGAHLALATLAYAEACRVVARNWTGLTGGGAGLVGIPPLPALGTALGPAADRLRTYYLALALLSVALLTFAALRRTRAGLAWAALREQEIRARLLGVPATRYRLLAFALSGALTALGGALYAHTVRFVEPEVVFGKGLSVFPLVMATFGGLHTLWGPAAGALLLHLLAEGVLQPALPQLHQLPYALALVVTVLWLPGGLAGFARGR